MGLASLGTGSGSMSPTLLNSRRLRRKTAARSCSIDVRRLLTFRSSGARCFSRRGEQLEPGLSRGSPKATWGLMMPSALGCFDDRADRVLGGGPAERRHDQRLERGQAGAVRALHVTEGVRRGALGLRDRREPPGAHNARCQLCVRDSRDADSDRAQRRAYEDRPGLRDSRGGSLNWTLTRARSQAPCTCLASTPPPPSTRRSPSALLRSSTGASAAIWARSEERRVGKEG